MRIHRDDIDQQVVDKMLAGITASYQKPNPTSQELLARKLLYKRIYAPMKGVGKRALYWAAGLMAAGGGCSLAVAMSPEPEWAWVPILGVLGVIVCVWAAVSAVLSTTNRQSSAHYVYANEVAAWLPLVELTRAERAYCETLVLLSETGSHLDETTQRDILKRLNNLMTHVRRLDEQSNELRPVASADALTALKAERDELARRAANAVDPDAAGGLQKSAAMCDERLAHAKRVAPSLAKLESQQEVLFQALASVQASLARSKAAAATLSMVDVDEINQKVTEINDNAAAVELAVQEVMAAVNAT